METLKVQLVRPPVSVRVSAHLARERAFGHVIHHFPPVAVFIISSRFLAADFTRRIPSGKIDFNDCCDKLF
jgi:hypothetical protein